MRTAAVLNTTTWTDVSAVIYLKKWVAYKRINECWAAGVILDWNMNIMCRLNGSGSEEFFFPSWLPDIKWVALIQRLRRGSAVESNRMCVGQKCVDGVSGCSGFFQTAAGNLTLIWHSHAPVHTVHCGATGLLSGGWEAKEMELTASRIFSLMRYFDKVNYIQRTNNGGKTLVEPDCVHAAGTPAPVCSTKRKSELCRATRLMQSWNTSSASCRSTSVLWAVEIETASGCSVDLWANSNWIRRQSSRFILFVFAAGRTAIIRTGTVVTVLKL